MVCVRDFRFPERWPHSNLFILGGFPGRIMSWCMVLQCIHGCYGFISSSFKYSAVADVWKLTLDMVEVLASSHMTVSESVTSEIAEPCKAVSKSRPQESKKVAYLHFTNCWLVCMCAQTINTVLKKRIVHDKKNRGQTSESAVRKKKKKHGQYQLQDSHEKKGCGCFLLTVSWVILATKNFSVLPLSTN